MEIKFFEVGGSVRDRMLGLKPKDFDYSVEAPSYQAMSDYIHTTHDKVFLEKPEFLTIRAKKGNEVFDYVMCRKDGAYSDGRHPDSVEPGTILDDLARRDFTVNAMAVEMDSRLILDPFHGRDDIETMTLRCVGSAEERIKEDSLRLIRAARFCITKGFEPSQDIRDILKDPLWAKELRGISSDRIREELAKCFKHDSYETMRWITANMSTALGLAIFDGTIWLKPTNEKR